MDTRTGSREGERKPISERKQVCRWKSIPWLLCIMSKPFYLVLVFPRLISLLLPFGVPLTVCTELDLCFLEEWLLRIQIFLRCNLVNLLSLRFGKQINSAEDKAASLMIRGQVKPEQNSSMIPQIAAEHLLTAGLSALFQGSEGRRRQRG